ncbi:ankyrin [Aspergillus sclerotioniger CBS 115572]|uniref:Ankyrin n=1 Tax=Aspergillus sclerotioniger CBS 115572 TaxID=1450535 RepID=A0A317V533_9EURO|nr:ankyrin [Aspergillus sclerotioniger CBS 115572]PWY67977.1 ankyrin [Aspergillus sclerotioniger CBS 115572]
MPCSPHPFNDPIPDACPNLLSIPAQVREVYPGRLFTPEALARLTTTNRRFIARILRYLRPKSWIDAIPNDPTLPSRIGILPSGKWNRPCNLSHEAAPAVAYAIETGHLDRVMELVERTRIPANSSDRNSNCLLHIALVSNQIEIAEYLLLRGAYADGYHPSTIPELDHLFLSPSNTGPQCPIVRERILTLLLSHRASISRFPTQNMFYINPRNAPRFLEYLLDNHPEIADLRSASGHTLLHTAAALGDPESCEFLLERAPHLLTIDTDWGVTALHLAILEKNEPTACFLIDRGIRLHFRDKYNRTELFLAAAMGLPTVVEHLLELRTAERSYISGKWRYDAKAAVRLALYLGYEEIVRLIRNKYNLTWLAILKGYLTWANIPQTPKAPRAQAPRHRRRGTPRNLSSGQFVHRHRRRTASVTPTPTPHAHAHARSHNQGRGARGRAFQGRHHGRRRSTSVRSNTPTSVVGGSASGSASEARERITWWCGINTVNPMLKLRDIGTLGTCDISSVRRVLCGVERDISSLGGSGISRCFAVSELLVCVVSARLSGCWVCHQHG